MIFNFHLIFFYPEPHSSDFPHQNISFFKQILKGRKIHERRAAEAVTEIKCPVGIFLRGDKNSVQDIASFHLDKVPCEFLIDPDVLKYHVINIL